jgi:dethiobiotin synthetase
MRFFVTGTDTNVGKTAVSTGLLSAWFRQGVSASVLKPYESGMSSLAMPADSLALQAAAGSHQPLSDISWARFRQPLAPGMAVRALSASRQRKHARVFAAIVKRVRQTPGPLLVEGAGGLFVPLDETHDVVDLIEALRLPVIVVARAALGTINHTSLTVEALKARRCPIAAIVLNRTSVERDPAIALNAGELKRRYPKTLLLGPLPFVADASVRMLRFAKMLQPLLHQRAQPTRAK